MKSAKIMATLALAFILTFVLAACSGSAGSGSAVSSNGSQGSGSAQSSDASGSDEASETEQEAYTKALMGKELVSTFVGADITDAVVTNEDEAQKVAEGLVERMGGDKTTELDLVYVIPTETGNSYYIFQQEAGDVMVYGASAKLIVDKDGKVVGLVGAILPDVMLPPASETAVSQEQAEKVVVDELANQGMTDAKALSEYTNRAIVPLPNFDSRYCLAWVVYVASPSSDGDDQAYLANYVSVDGEYMSSIPVSEPNNAEALSGQAIGFDFGAYDQQEKTFDIKRGGETKQVTLPVLVDKQSGKVAFLGDAKRQILCVDFTEATQNDQLVSPFEEDGESFNENDLGVYENFIRIYDFYESIGWTGPNGQGTPSLLMMNYMENGELGDNCAYFGHSGGWETFAFGRVRDYGSATDIIAHEFTHCVTSTTMTTNLYLNEPGAINEGMSDIMGNLVEMALDGDAGAWILGEQAVQGGMRSMSNPTEHAQPEYRWGIYYTPDAPEGTQMNDSGGVHGNSSLLNIVSYKLDKAGMSGADQVYFWMNVALAMVPTNDYAQMAELLPWVLNQSGFGQYADALKQAIDDAGYTKLERPSELPEGAGVIELTYPNAEVAEQGQVRIMFLDQAAVQTGSSDVWTWPVTKTELASATLYAGDYYVVTMVGAEPFSATIKVYTDTGWVDFQSGSDKIADKGTLVHVDEGQTVDLATNGLE